MALYDPFEGIDPERVSPGEYGPSTNYVEEANRHDGSEGLYDTVKSRFAAFPEVAVHKGFLPAALEGTAPDRIAWLHVDLNAARPEVETLEALFERVVPGGLIVLDDYGWLVLNAQKKAEDAFFAARGYDVLELPTGQGLVVKRPVATRRVSVPEERSLTLERQLPSLKAHAEMLDGIEPWSGEVEGGFEADFLGIKTAHAHLPLSTFPEGSKHKRRVDTRLPRLEDGELWFEPADWVAAAREARERFVMVTLGANYGAQAVGAAAALRALNPMPFKLVAVEPVPENFEWTKAHMRANGIDPDEQWLVQCAISDRREPVLFPVGSPGSGAQNCYATDEQAARANYAAELTADEERCEAALRGLLLENTTGLVKNLVPGYDLPAEIRLVSAVTLEDILGPFERVDFIESDIQQSEILVFPPFMDLLKKKVRRIHIGTHGAEVHAALLEGFVRDGWEIVFDFEPNTRFETPLGDFETNDGVLTVVNPELRK